ncbi:MAG: peptide ABC transporter permease [Gammaproteobacteria bacterium]|nr:peptide ABC transporter permease [Gammaproteobacteria bacterium]HAJ06619.1 peptide ABC transporter permease [Chloroflexota bacterium]
MKAIVSTLKGRRLTGVGSIGLIIVTVVVILAIIGPYVSPHDPIQHNLKARYKPLGYSDDNGTYILGTDQLGRDIFSRIIAGCRVSVIVSIFAVVIAGSIGVSYGLIAGFVGGWIDQIMMRIADALLSIPFIVLVVAISGVVGAGIFTLILILGFTGWVTYARVTRGEVLVAKELDYVIAATVVGQSKLKIMFQHILPNVMSSAVVLAALQVGVTIIAESSLSFLGLGVQPPSVTWGLMLADGRASIGSAWWMTTFPGIAITVVVLGVVFLGDWMRDVLDPRLRGE